VLLGDRCTVINAALTPDEVAARIKEICERV
jgi:hypothetical protein